jgi:hypothetical protein
MIGNAIIAVAIGTVLCVLLAGLYTIWAGGEVSRSWSNRLMRLRVLAQFVAIVIIMTVVYFTRRH